MQTYAATLGGTAILLAIAVGMGCVFAVVGKRGSLRPVTTQRLMVASIALTVILVAAVLVGT